MTINITAYKNIIVAIDFSASSNKVAARALDLAQANSEKLTLLHAVEYFSPLSFGDELIPSPDWLLVEEQLVKQSEKSLLAFAIEMNMEDAPRVVVKGSPTHEIVAFADTQSADLIIVGTHGRHGLARLLGSTASSVIRHAACDVLAVRL